MARCCASRPRVERKPVCWAEPVACKDLARSARETVRRPGAHLRGTDKRGAPAQQGQAAPISGATAGRPTLQAIVRVVVRIRVRFVPGSNTGSLAHSSQALLVLWEYGA